MTKILQAIHQWWTKATLLHRSLKAIGFGFLVGAFIILFSGKNPFQVYFYLFNGSFLNLQRIGNVLAMATTLTLTGLSVMFAFRTGLFNIGAPGQMLIAALAAYIFALNVNWPWAIALPVTVLIAMLTGAFWGFISGALKAYLNVNEVVSSIMLNWIAYWIVAFVVQNYIFGAFTTETRPIPAANSLRVEWLTKLFTSAGSSASTFINLGIFIAIGMVFLMQFILRKTVLGFELRAVGHNRHAAQYAGMNVPSRIILSMVIAGATAGLAGATHYIGAVSSLKINVLPPQGFDAFAVALVGGNSPYGVLFSALFFAIITYGKEYMAAMTRIPNHISSIIIATIVYFSAAASLFESEIGKTWWKKIRTKLPPMKWRRGGK